MHKADVNINIIFEKLIYRLYCENKISARSEQYWHISLIMHNADININATFEKPIYPLYCENKISAPLEKYWHISLIMHKADININITIEKPIYPLYCENKISPPLILIILEYSSMRKFPSICETSASKFSIATYIYLLLFSHIYYL